MDRPLDSPVAKPQFFWLTAVVLLVILLFSAWTRSRWPSVPAADPDTWGYLHPALSKLNGQGFVHTQGRNYVYPGWLYLLLACTGDFRAIPLAQHGLGLASGVLLWTCWRQWHAWITQPRLPAWADALIGLGMVAFYEQSPSAISTEHHIRPEAIFSFFALLDIALLLAFLRAWYVGRQPGRASVLAGGGLCVAMLLYQLKPSFGLALAAAAAPVALAMLFPLRQPLRTRWLLGGAVGASIITAAGVFVWPEHRLSRDDAMSTLFLPETLLCIHADLVCDQLAVDIREHAAIPYPADWLADTQATLAANLRQAALNAGRTYPALGFNPDYLMYDGNSFCAGLTAHFDPAQTAAFAFYYYQRVWTHRPGRMLAKIGRQLGVFYALRCPTFAIALPARRDKFYSRSLEPFNNPARQREMNLYPPARDYLDAVQRLNAAGVHLPDPSAMTTQANSLASVAVLPFLILLGLGLIVSGLAWVGVVQAPEMAELLAAGGLLLWFHALAFGSVLTVAIVHSLDIGRYSTNLTAFYALALAGTAAWLAELALALRTRRWSERSSIEN